MKSQMKKRKKMMRRTQDLPSNSRVCVETVENLGTWRKTVRRKTKTELEEETLTIEEEDLEEVEEDFKEEAMEETTTIKETMDNKGLEENVFTVEFPDTKKRTVERRKQKKSERTKR